ncbi:putative sulfate exporter family transporter [Ottowia sp.]|jgi:uncharacterized integral membrane protein (TIGR00698 family)|uniref:YeiH family protein n=1 Tax=Ottowia sp. TaxID=1898956 RepID=UPI0025E2E819|nr:putative sulfate exporter family transporter [Ottowia sp.]MBK6613894.1 putative sulfate exporter family transporter [Ottowia sp.]MBK6745544.1 putative sulfate exporter family transporter [Ottowia sp.]
MTLHSFGLRAAACQARLPGLLTAVTLALAASFIAEHHGGPALLYALLFGMVFNFAAEGPKVKEGLEFTARHVLRLGIALLGARITLDQIVSLGPWPVALVLGAMALTMALGAWFGRRLGHTGAEGLLAGGAVAICGASAALALSAVLPRSASSQRFTLLTVVGVTTLSTIAMVVYPLLGKAIGLDTRAMGTFLGGTIHDVAQVVASGYMVSAQVGDVATVVKLMRVSMLVPVVLLMSMIYRGTGTDPSSRPPLLPGFLVVFVVLAICNSLGWIPVAAGHAAGELSRWCLIVAIAALGVKTSFKQLAELGWRPVWLLVIETTLLAAIVLGGMLAVG